MARTLRSPSARPDQGETRRRASPRHPRTHMTTEVELQQAVHQHPAPNELDALASEFSATIETLSARNLHDSAEALAQQMTQVLPHQGFGWKTLAYAHLRRGD